MKNIKLLARALFLLLTVTLNLPAGDLMTCKLIACPKEWKIPKNTPTGKILLAWEVSNAGDASIRFRIRDLGYIKLVDSGGKVLLPEKLGVDATKPFENSDYPLIASNETLYFPFAVLFRRQEDGLFSLKLRSDPEGDEGWSFSDLKSGKYTIVGHYSSKHKSDGDGGFMWGHELEYLKKRFLDRFWVGEAVSMPIEISIVD